MISPFGFTFKVFMLTILGFIGFVIGSCIVMWIVFKIMNWLFDERMEMDEYRQSEEYINETKDAEERIKENFEKEFEFIQKLNDL